MRRDPIGADPPAGSAGSDVLRFADFQLDPASGELSRNGGRQTLGEQPLAVLLALLKRPGQLVTREELQQRLWPGETFVDFEHGLNAAVKRLRDALHDSADAPRLIETLPRRGYRFIGECEAAESQSPADQTRNGIEGERPAAGRPLSRRLWIAAAASFILVSLLAWIAVATWRSRSASAFESRAPRHVTMLAYGPGLQTDPTWSPDGQSVAYAWDKSGNFDIWTQRVAGGDPVQITRSPMQELQPDWSPDGSSLVFSRPEGKDSGLFVVPASGGPEQRLTTFGGQPKWSPDGSRVLFVNGLAELYGAMPHAQLFVVPAKGGAPQRILSAVLDSFFYLQSAAWHPDGRRISMWGMRRCCAPEMELVTASLDGSSIEISHVEKARGLPSGPNVSRGSLEWDSSGGAVYVTSIVLGAIEVWRVTVDSARHEGIAAERIVGDGLHRAFAVAPDGRHLAFTSENVSSRVWSFELDASGRTVDERGRALSPAGVLAFDPDLANDDRSLAYSTPTSASMDLWVTDLHDGRAKMIGTAGETGPAQRDTTRILARWSRDAKRLAYFYHRLIGDTPPTVLSALVMWRRDTDDEIFLSTVRRTVAPEVREEIMPTDWTLDNAAILAVSNRSTPTMSIGLWPVSAAPRADTAVKVLASDPAYNLWQARFSPNNRWIACVAQKVDDNMTHVAIMPSGGGDRSRWRMLGDPQGSTDKPRWSPDGRILYFTHFDGGYYDLWGQPFDPESGTAVGAPFKMTHFDSPAFYIVKLTGYMEPDVSRTQLILPMAERTGRILIMDNVGP